MMKIGESAGLAEVALTFARALSASTDQTASTWPTGKSQNWKRIPCPSGLSCGTKWKDVEAAVSNMMSVPLSAQVAAEEMTSLCQD